MSQKQEPRIREYVTNLKGEDPYDEARRAAADLCIRTRMWVILAEANEEALDPATSAMFDDESLEDSSAPRRSGLINPGTQADDLRLRVREHWPIWTKAMHRFKSALPEITDSDADRAKSKARRSLMLLHRTFFPPIVLMPDEMLGDQLLRPAGPLFCRAGKRSALRREKVDRILQPIADFSDLMITYDLRPNGPVGPDFDGDSGWTVGKLCERIGRSESKLKSYREAADPAVPGRGARGETFRYGELALIAEGALKVNHRVEAQIVRAIIQNRERP